MVLESPPMIKPKRRSSSSITLVLISATAMSACGQSSAPGPNTMRRDTYTSLADCKKDWGADPAKCQGQTSRSSTGSGYTHFYGPSYRAGDYGSTRSLHSDGSSTAARPGSNAMGTTHVSRSGFGSSASSHSSSGAHAGSSGS